MGGLFSFDGRIGRQTFWVQSILIFVVVFVAVMIFGGLLGEPANETEVDGGTAVFGLTMIIGIIAAQVASIAVQVKRWHDRGKSGWWVLIGFIPYIGSLWVLVECGFLAGTPGQNQYGPQP